MVCAATWGHGDIWANASARGHLWIHGPVTTRVCVDVWDPCYYQRPCGCTWSGLLPVAMLTSKYCAELAPTLCLGSMGELVVVGGYRRAGPTPYWLWHLGNRLYLAWEEQYRVSPGGECKGEPAPRAWAWESWPCHSSAIVGYGCPTSRAQSWPIPTFTSSMNC